MWQGLQNLWTNATTGSLTEAQKVSIAQDATLSLTKCQKTPYDPDCTQLLQDNGNLVDYVAASDDLCSDGVLNVPVIGCISSWTNVALIGIALIFVVGIAYHVAINRLSRS